MRAAVLVKPAKIQIENCPRISPSTGEVEIEVSYVGICGSDLGRFEGHLTSPKPVIFGHEFSGRVSRWGEGVTGFRKEQPVTVAPLLNCGYCKYCLIGKGYLCEKRVRFGTDVDGAFRRFVSLRADRIYPLSEDRPLIHGALAEPLAVAMHAVHQAGSISGARVAVIGAGAIGLLIAIVASTYNAESITLIDIDASRIQLAKNLGFFGFNSLNTNPINSIQLQTGDTGIDVLFEASGSPMVGPYLLSMLAKMGTVVVVGRMEESIPINFDMLLMKEARLVSSRYFSLLDFQEAVGLIANGLPSLDLLIGGIQPFSNFLNNSGRQVMADARKSVRLVIDLGMEEE